jgi:serine/threonine-protein kinase
MGYAPPELFAGKVEPRSDIYSLGATMFHMLTGSDPQDNPLLIFDFSKNPRPRQLNPSISAEMEHILTKAVAHKPEDRHTNALEFMRMLEEHSARLESRARQDSHRPAGASSYPGPGQIPANPLPLAGEPREPRSSYPPVSAGTSQPVSSGPVMEWVFCGHCGERIGAEDVYCAHCGHRQPMTGSAPGAGYSSTGSSPRVTAQLVVVGTSDMVKPFIIDKENVMIGRTDPHTGIFPEIDLTMYDPETKVSRRHARIYRQGEQFLIEDLGSVNGTVVISVSGGQIRLNTKAPRVLSAGDEIKLGGTTLKFMVA